LQGGAGMDRSSAAEATTRCRATDPRIPFGGEGDDTLRAARAPITLDGAPGRDLASYGDSDEGVTVRLWAGDGRGGGGGRHPDRDRGSVGFDFGDTLVGDEGDNRLFGGAGPDALWGNSGDDVLIGGLRGDALNGQAGFDWASYEGSVAGVTVRLWAGDGNGGDARATGSTGSRPCGVPTMPTRWSAMRVAIC
jgi:Ca2+-binding RTX toxin-like protein